MPIVSFRCTPYEYSQLRAQSDATGYESVSGYVRTKVLGPETPSNLNLRDGRYVELTNEVKVLSQALHLAGLDDKINQARAWLGGEEPDGNRNNK